MVLFFLLSVLVQSSGSADDGKGCPYMLCGGGKFYGPAMAATVVVIVVFSLFVIARCYLVESCVRLQRL